MTTISKLNDKELFKLSREYGSNAKKYSRLFASLLPEIMKRRLHRKHGCASIHEFAAKFCGMSKENVNEILRIYAQVEDKPLVKEQIALQGWSKVRVVMSVLTKENERIIAEKLENLSKSSLTEWLKEKRNELLEAGMQSISELSEENQADIVNPQLDFGDNTGNFDTTTHVADSTGDNLNSINYSESVARSSASTETTRLPDMSSEGRNSGLDKPIPMFDNLSGEEPASQKTGVAADKKLSRLEMKVNQSTELQFRSLKNQFEKQHGALTNGETLKFLLSKIKKLEAELHAAKKGKNNHIPKRTTSVTKNHEHVSQNTLQAAKTLEHVLQNTLETAETKGKPANQHAQNGAQEIALNKQKPSRYIPKILKIQLEQKYQGKCAYPTCKHPSIITHHPERFSLTHNHKNLAPLCKIHHELAHNCLIENETKATENWRLKLENTDETASSRVDDLYKLHR